MRSYRYLKHAPENVDFPLLLVLLRPTGLTSKDLARKLSVNYGTVKSWINVSRKEHLNPCTPRHRLGNSIVNIAIKSKMTTDNLILCGIPVVEVEQ